MPSDALDSTIDAAPGPVQPHRDLVLVLTAHGVDELQTPRAGLSLPQRWLLARCDGQASLAQLAAAAGSPPLDRLVRAAAKLLGAGLAEHGSGLAVEVNTDAGLAGRVSRVTLELPLESTEHASVPPVAQGASATSPAAVSVAFTAAAAADALPAAGASMSTEDRRLPRWGAAGVALAGLLLALGMATLRESKEGAVDAAAPSPRVNDKPSATPAPASPPAPTGTGAAAVAAAESMLVVLAARPGPGPTSAEATPARPAVGAAPAPTVIGNAVLPVGTRAFAEVLGGPPRGTTAGAAVQPAAAGASPGAALPAAAAGPPPAPAVAPVVAATPTASPTTAPTAAPAAAVAPAPTATPSTGAPNQAPTTVTTGAQAALPAVVPAPSPPAAVAVTAALPPPAPTTAQRPALAPLSTVMPSFPREGFPPGDTEIVLQARLTVSPDGSVTQVDFLGSASRWRAFERSARSAMLQWRFPEGSGDRSYVRQIRFSEQ